MLLDIGHVDSITQLLLICLFYIEIRTHAICFVGFISLISLMHSQTLHERCCHKIIMCFVYTVELANVELNIYFHK